MTDKRLAILNEQCNLAEFILARMYINLDVSDSARAEVQEMIHRVRKIVKECYFRNPPVEPASENALKALVGSPVPGGPVDSNQTNVEPPKPLKHDL